jgi:hypothetical protein
MYCQRSRQEAAIIGYFPPQTSSNAASACGLGT